MPSRSRRMPRGWTSNPELHAAYAEGGERIGELMVFQPELAERVWKLLAGTGIWPKWYMEGFRYLWIKEHPVEYQRWKKGRFSKRHSDRRYKDRLQKARDIDLGA